MKIKLFVILSLLGIGSLILYQGQNGKVRMNDDAKSMKEEIQMFDDAKSMKAEVLKHVPIGTSIQDAKQVMEENGFRCGMYNNAGFVEIQEGPPRRSIAHDNADFLLCHKKKVQAVPVMTEWKIIIVHKNDVISDIFVNFILTGP